MKNYNLIVFDWDGTLMDSMAAIIGAIEQTAMDLNLRFPTKEESRRVIGLGLNEAFENVWPELEKEKYADLIQSYRHHYLNNDGHLQFYSGILSLLQHLQTQNKTLAIATGKSKIGLMRALENTKSAHFFKAMRTADDCFSKPHPQMLLELMEELAFLPEETLMVGDSIHDLLMANAAGVDCVSVTYGAFEEKDLLSGNPKYVAHSVEELNQILAT